jgi:cobalamin biosynthesis Mg chelatase CobN
VSKDNCIELKNIDLIGISIVQQMDKRKEEYDELTEAIFEYVRTKGDPKAKEHLLEEICDNTQVNNSMLKVLGIELEELV